MRDRKLPLVLLIVAILCIPPAVTAAGEGPGPEAAVVPRGEYSQQGSWEGELKLTGGYYTNSNLTVSLPNNATINFASLDILGKWVEGPKQSMDCDFASDPGNQYTAYAGVYNKNAPGSAKPSAFQGAQLQGSELSSIAYSDARYAQYWGYGWNSEWAFHHFQFKLPLDKVTKVVATYEGFAGYSYYGVGTVAAYIWNNASQAWDVLGTGSDSPKSTFMKEFNGPGHLTVQGNYKYIDLLAICQKGSNVYGNEYNVINTDYVKIYVEGNVLTYPANPKLTVGSAYNPAWSIQTDKFDFLVSVGTADLMNQIQDVTRRATTQYAEVRFTFRSETVGRVNVTNLKISYTSPPWYKGGLDRAYSLEEDTPNPKLIDLNQYFTDDIDEKKLRFDIIYEEDSKKLDADIDPAGWMGFKLPTKNWWGSMRFQVRATDSDSLTRDSPKFTVSVTSVNDPPVISPIGHMIATEEVPFTLQVRARDVDMDLDPEEMVMFSDNTSLFEIDTSTGKASFTPRQEQVGLYSIGIIATDLLGDTDQENFTLEIMDAEDAPVLDDIPDQSAMQDQPFLYTVTATDPDLPYGDSLRFFDNSPLFVIEPDTGLISFTPTVKDIGSYLVSITVNDARGGTDVRQFELKVLNLLGTLNRPPAVEAVPDLTAQEGVQFEHTVKGSDPDFNSGDSISYADNCPVFDIGAGSGRISFKPTAKDAGSYKVKVTVKDREGLTATVEFNLTVLKTNHPPEITEVLPKDGTEVLAKRAFKLSAAARDVDGDRINYTWMDGPTVLGYGPEITVSFPDEGTYIITVIASDGKLEKVNETTIEVVDRISTGGPSGSGTPGFGAALAAAAVALAALGMARRRGLRR
ncbi:MAG: hypothetical protein FJ149_02210 [Euryarchaeota archaeon]|nr:hypothetical protein [Euryarchaeota archaeon]